VVLANTGSFDCVRHPLRQCLTPLRMTVLGWVNDGFARDDGILSMNDEFAEDDSLGSMKDKFAEDDVLGVRKTTVRRTTAYSLAAYRSTILNTSAEAFRTVDAS
jgi:hypothetical protein